MGDINHFEIFSKRINAIPYKVLYDIVYHDNYELILLQHSIAQLTCKKLRKFEKIQIAKNIMELLQTGHIELKLYGIGYSIEHIELILNDLNTCYNNIYV